MSVVPRVVLDTSVVVAAMRSRDGASYQVIQAARHGRLTPLVTLEPVEVHLRWRPQLPDADDELVLEAAMNGQADALVTHNIRDFTEAGRRLGLRLLRPGDLLKELQR